MFPLRNLAAREGLRNKWTPYTLAAPLFFILIINYNSCWFTVVSSRDYINSTPYASIWHTVLLSLSLQLLSIQATEQLVSPFNCKLVESCLDVCGEMTQWGRGSEAITEHRLPHGNVTPMKLPDCIILMIGCHCSNLSLLLFPQLFTSIGIIHWILRSYLTGVSTNYLI